MDANEILKRLEHVNDAILFQQSGDPCKLDDMAERFFTWENKPYLVSLEMSSDGDQYVVYGIGNDNFTFVDKDEVVQPLISVTVRDYLAALKQKG